MRAVISVAFVLFVFALCPITALAEASNLLVNPSFEIDSNGDGVPDGWTAASPDAKLRPLFQLATEPVRSGRFSAALRSEGGYRFGLLHQDVPVEAGKTYEVVVRYRCEGIDNPNRCVLVDLVWGGKGYNDAFLAHWQREGDWFVGRQKFTHRGGKVLRINLILRVEGAGAVFFDDLVVRPATPNPRRVAKVASYSIVPKEKDKVARAKAIVPAIEEAAAAGCDVICLSEGLNYDSGKPILPIAETIPGPMYDVFAQAARDNKIYVIGCIWQRDGDYVYNTAFLIDRAGKLAGRYRKTHLHWPEMIEGVRPGSDYPVFDCDFGRIGIMICYDNWFPEVTRVLALKGAEIIFCPAGGYGKTCQIGNSVANGTYFVSAASSAATRKDNIICGPGFDVLASGGAELLMSEVELSEPKPYHYRQWQTCGMPQAFRQMPNTVNERCLEEILKLYRTVPSPESQVR